MFEQPGAVWSVEIEPEAGLVLQNAGNELRDFLIGQLGARIAPERGGEVRCITLGTAASSFVNRILGPKSLECCGNRRTRRLVRTCDGDIIIVGSDERAVLDGVFALEEWLIHGQLPTVCDRTWTDLFSIRMNTYYCGEANQTLGYEAYRTLARMGYTHYCANMVKNSSDHTALCQLVIPKYLPVTFNRDEIEEFQRQTNERIANMKVWGIKPWFYVFEPAGPDLLGPTIPEEVTGRRYVYWKSREDRTLCVNHPLVRQYYRALIHDLIRTYPDVDFLGFYCDDGSYWFCDPVKCPRCGKQAEKQDVKNRHIMKSHTDFLNMLQEAAREIHPTFSVGMATLHLENQIEQDPPGFVNRLTPGVHIDHNPHYSDGFLYEQPSAAEWLTWDRLAGAAKDKGVSLLAWDEYVITESLHPVKTLPTVFATARKLADYAAKGIEGLYVEGMPTPGIFNPANLVWQLMVTGEITDSQSAIAEAIRRSYGNAAAPLMLKALEALDTGLTVFNRDELAIDLYIRFLLCVNLDQQIKIPILPTAIVKALRQSFFVYPANGTRETGPRHFLPEIMNLARSAEPFFAEAITYVAQAYGQAYAEHLLAAGNTVTSAVLDHPDLRRRSAADTVDETLHALRLWAALFKVWANRLEAVHLVHLLNVNNDFQPPRMDEYRKTGEQLIQLAEGDCANLERVAALIDLTPDQREVLKFQAHATARVVNRAVAHDARVTLEQTQEFLKDPWPELYTFWMKES